MKGIALVAVAALLLVAGTVWAFGPDPVPFTATGVAVLATGIYEPITIAPSFSPVDPYKTYALQDCDLIVGAYADGKLVVLRRCSGPNPE